MQNFLSILDLDPDRIAKLLELAAKLKRERVKPILDMAISRFNAFARMQSELDEARSQLESRKIVDRAKGILMKTHGLSEADAYALLRKTAMNRNRKISDIAESLITAAGLLTPPEET